MGLIPACAGQTRSGGALTRRRTAHPRVCGADRTDVDEGWEATGSSPRVRGRPPGVGAEDDAGGLIPACAGQTAPSFLSAPCRVGSSPRVRGRPRSRQGAGRRLGLIPACAGQTTSSTRSSPRLWAHPRVCGADQQDEEPIPSGTGLIPACAGQTRWTRPTCLPSWAHPRVCGADEIHDLTFDRGEGSSPRVRGRLAITAATAHLHGLIPACAGQTYSENAPLGVRAAHPRVCGADGDTMRDAEIPDRLIPACAGQTFGVAPGHLYEAGSSPRVRGRLAEEFLCAGLVRLIPACAGQTCRGLFGPSRRRGSSPRVRGKPVTVVISLTGWGLIPACAGQTYRATRTTSPATAHPRVCGADLTGNFTNIGNRGSSPRVRGRRLRRRLVRLQ